jgi:hypothetical protein
MQEHRDVGIGVNYWLNPAFVVKLNYHVVRGNRYAAARDSAAILQGQPFRNDTRMLVLGAQFSF